MCHVELALPVCCPVTSSFHNIYETLSYDLIGPLRRMKLIKPHEGIGIGQSCAISSTEVTVIIISSDI